MRHAAANGDIAIEGEYAAALTPNRCRFDPPRHIQVIVDGFDASGWANDRHTDLGGGGDASGAVAEELRGLAHVYEPAVRASQDVGEFVADRDDGRKRRAGRGRSGCRVAGLELSRDCRRGHRRGLAAGKAPGAAREDDGAGAFGGTSMNPPRRVRGTFVAAASLRRVASAALVKTA